MPEFSSLELTEQLARLTTAALEALKKWTFKTPEISLLKYRENAVFKVSAENKSFILRIHRANYHSVEAVASELAWIDALKRAHLKVPSVLPTKEQKRFTTVRVQGDSSLRIVDLFEWVEGITVADALGTIELTYVEPLFKEIGKAAAQLHNHSSRWQVPTEFKRHHWDIEGLLGEEPFWGKFWELGLLTREQRELVLEARDALKAQLQLYPKTKETYGLIHADTIPDNLILSGEGLTLIDFDDAGFGYYLFELATILRPIEDKPFYTLAKEAVLAGYQEHRALSQNDLDYLEGFQVARALSYLGWFHDRPELCGDVMRVRRAVEKACTHCRNFLA